MTEVTYITCRWLHVTQCSFPFTFQIMKLMSSILGEKLFNMLMKSTFYGHFVAGEDQVKIVPTLERWEGWCVSVMNKQCKILARVVWTSWTKWKCSANSFRPLSLWIYFTHNQTSQAFLVRARRASCFFFFSPDLRFVWLASSHNFFRRGFFPRSLPTNNPFDDLGYVDAR